MMTDAFKSEQYWAQAWTSHIDRYLESPPRAGYWMESVLDGSGTIVEIAGGSCRDSRYLADALGWKAIGTDFDQQTLDYLGTRFPASRLPLQREDGFAMSFEDKSVDVSFSNGFLVLFEQDEDIVRLISEAARITSSRMIIIVHNKENHGLRERFARKSAHDDLYRIRFFDRSEIVDLIVKSGIRRDAIRVTKFGGYVDNLYRRRIRGLPNPLAPLARHIVPRSYGLLPWHQVERIACLVDLQSAGSSGQ